LGFSLCSIQRNNKGIQKNMKNPIERDSANAARVKKVADIAGVTERYVRLVLTGERKNSYIMSLYMHLQEGETLLLKAVKELVPFN
jgi:predicted transcriptional regulator